MLMQGPVSSELMTASVASNHLIIVGRFEQLLISAKPDSPENVVGKASCVAQPGMSPLCFYRNVCITVKQNNQKMLQIAESKVNTLLFMFHP